MTPPLVFLCLLFAAGFMAFGFVAFVIGADSPHWSLQAKLLPGIALTFVGAVLFALPAILAK